MYAEWRTNQLASKYFILLLILPVLSILCSPQKPFTTPPLQHKKPTHTISELRNLTHVYSNPRPKHNNRLARKAHHLAASRSDTTTTYSRRINISSSTAQTSPISPRRYQGQEEKQLQRQSQKRAEEIITNDDETEGSDEGSRDGRRHMVD